MSRGLRDWDRVSAAKRGQAAAHEALVDGVLLVHAKIALVHDGDVMWLKEILAAPELTPFERKIVEQSIAWLRGAASRTLTAGRRRQFRAIEVRVEKKRAGTYRPPSQELIERAKTRRALRKARRDENRAKATPAWSLDPSLLPKRPPGRATGGTP